MDRLLFERFVEILGDQRQIEVCMIVAFESFAFQNQSLDVWRLEEAMASIIAALSCDRTDLLRIGSMLSRCPCCFARRRTCHSSDGRGSRWRKTYCSHSRIFDPFVALHVAQVIHIRCLDEYDERHEFLVADQFQRLGDHSVSNCISDGLCCLPLVQGPGHTSCRTGSLDERNRISCRTSVLRSDRARETRPARSRSPFHPFPCADRPRLRPYVTYATYLNERRSR